MPTAVQTRIFNRYGRESAEIDAGLQSISWRLNDYGQSRFSMPWADAKCTKAMLRPGNRVLHEFSTGLPAWAGTIDVPRGRTFGTTDVTAYTGEKLLDSRYTIINAVYDAIRPGAIFQDLIMQVNAIHATSITLGEIYAGGSARDEEYHYHNLYDAIVDLARLSGHDFAVLPNITTASIEFIAGWYERRGRDLRTKIHLIHGVNVSAGALDEQGTIANHIIVVGEGQDWDADRPTAIADDLESQDRYGYREHVVILTDIGDIPTLQATADALLVEMAYPRNRITLSATNQVPALYSEYDVGDIVWAELFLDSVGWHFDAAVRVLAREWDANTDSCTLEVEEYAF